MLVLFETPAGFAVFKLLDERKLLKSDNLFEDFENGDKAKRVVKLKMFDKFKDTTDALASAAALIEGKMSKGLKKLLKKVAATDAHEKLAVADAKLGNAIKKKLEINCVFDSNVMELMRCIRSQLTSLLDEDKEINAMSLGLGHSLSRYKLKFSPDKIDTMIVQAVSLLDELDKELNNYVMRAREWYGWHFPEMSKVVTDNLAYVRTVHKMGLRSNASEADLSDILPEEVEKALKEAAEISMGTEISSDDMLNIRHLCEQIVEIQEYREQLYTYLKNRMVAIAPNLTILVGELVGARLISHAGSLMNLAKHPASTVQILGAEKALFKALKTKHDTPKYGLIYHAQIIGQVSTALKGKVSRSLAAKASLACRMDAFGEEVETSTELGIEQRLKIETRIRQLEGGHKFKVSGTGKMSAKFDKYEHKSEIHEYKVADDNTLTVVGSGTKRKPDGDGDAGSPVKKVRVLEDSEVSQKVATGKHIKELKELGDDEDDIASGVEQKKTKKKKKNKVEDGDGMMQKTTDDRQHNEPETAEVNGDSTASIQTNGVPKKKKKKKVSTAE